MIEVVNKNIFFTPANDTALDAWLRENVFSYESRLPQGMDPFLVLKEDLRRSFPYDVGIEQRKVRTMVLKKINHNVESLKAC